MAVAFNTLYQIERWLHQHIFKVGWLVTKNFQTTTIIYYTFFLPGVVIYELTLWLVAGALDVRAERSIVWPEPQEIGEIRMNFVQLSRRASSWKVRLIYLTPMISGMALIWIIGFNILDLSSVVKTISEGGLSGVSAGIGRLSKTTDFWLWAYFLFTIGNTMLPDPGILKSWWWALLAAGGLAIPFFLLGVQDQYVGATLTGPIADVFQTLLIIFGVIIAFDVAGVALLSLVENTIEYITGDSATFKNGKMIVMTREEAIEERKREREAARRRERRAAAASTPSGPPSIYKINFPIPGSPGQEPVTSIPTRILEPQERPGLPGIRRDEPSVIAGASRRTADEDEGTGIRFGGAASRHEASADNEEDEAAPVRPRFDLPAGGQDDEDADGKPPAARPRFGQRPASDEPEADNVDDDEEDDEEVAGRPRSGIQPRPSRFSRTKLASGDEDEEDEDDDAESGTRSRSGIQPRPSPFSRTKPASDDDEEVDGDEDDEPEDRLSGLSSGSARPRPSPFSRPGATSSPVRSFGGVRPSPFNRAGSEDDEDEDEDDEPIYEDVDDSV